MKIHEFQAKELLRSYGIPVPRGKAASTPDTARHAAEQLKGRAVIKAQIHAGGRGKGGGVRTAASPDEALRISAAHPESIDLLVSDVVMPGMNGRDLARELTAKRPNLRSLFMSGYTSHVIARHGFLEPGLHFLQKPFTLEDLAAAVRSTLDGR